jgi:mannosyltransferase OCH1-like enzyme
MSIPKIIHYIWVGDRKITPLTKECILSWKKYLPDYELKFWTEANSPMSHHYVQAMYAQKKWAFVADYIRFWALEKEGGIYLDSGDTEVLKSFNALLGHGAFFGQTKDGTVAAGVIGAIPNHQAIKDILAVYDNDKEYSIARTSPRTVSDVLAKQKYHDVKIYDYRYFNPCDDGEERTAEKLALAYTDNHWAESWVSFRSVRKLARRLGVMPFFKKIYVIFLNSRSK